MMLIGVTCLQTKLPAEGWMKPSIHLTEAETYIYFSPKLK